MKRTGLLLLACLMLALHAMAQAPEKAAPKDLVVTAEIVGHTYEPAEKLDGKPTLVLSARMTVRNTTNHKREITVMFCDWDWAWTSKGAYRICGPNYCDANFPEPIIIPPGQSVEFYDKLCRNKRQGYAFDTAKFQLGFTDISNKNYIRFLFNKRLSRKPRVYWSNELRDDARPVATEEIKEKVLHRQHGLQGALNGAW